METFAIRDTCYTDICYARHLLYATFAMRDICYRKISDFFGIFWIFQNFLRNFCPIAVTDYNLILVEIFARDGVGCIFSSFRRTNFGLTKSGLDLKTPKSA